MATIRMMNTWRGLAPEVASEVQRHLPAVRIAYLFDDAALTLEIYLTAEVESSETRNTRLHNSSRHNPALIDLCALFTKYCVYSSNYCIHELTKNIHIT